jgi:hypothetical protein
MPFMATRNVQGLSSGVVAEGPSFCCARSLNETAIEIMKNAIPTKLTIQDPMHFLLPSVFTLALPDPDGIARDIELLKNVPIASPIVARRAALCYDDTYYMI